MAGKPPGPDSPTHRTATAQSPWPAARLAGPAGPAPAPRPLPLFPRPGSEQGASQPNPPRRRRGVGIRTPTPRPLGLPSHSPPRSPSAPAPLPLPSRSISPSFPTATERRHGLAAVNRAATVAASPRLRVRRRLRHLPRPPEASAGAEEPRITGSPSPSSPAAAFFTNSGDTPLLLLNNHRPSCVPLGELPPSSAL